MRRRKLSKMLSFRARFYSPQFSGKIDFVRSQLSSIPASATGERKRERERERERESARERARERARAREREIERERARGGAG